MKQLSVILGIIVFVVSSCLPETKKEKVEFPYKLIDSKMEVAGNNVNKMDLFITIRDLSVDTLKIFCKEHKKNFSSGTFYYLVVFDEEENALFPSSPFTSEYGLDEQAQKHIRAIYTFNRINGYSELNFYSKNKWESTAQSEKI